jgi:hypothetical protein
MLSGEGSENALPSTDWLVVLNAIEIVTYRGTRMVSDASDKMTVVDNLPLSLRLLLGFVVLESRRLEREGPGSATCAVIRVHSFRE